jgi:formylglycine-generating enzyme required for sulfatase activity
MVRQEREVGIVDNQNARLHRWAWLACGGIAVLIVMACALGLESQAETPRETGLEVTEADEPSPMDEPVPEIRPPRITEVDGMVLLHVPQGTFLMGSSQGLGGPEHEVYLDAFWIDQTEVTNAMFAAFLNAEGNQRESDRNWFNERDSDARIHEVGGKWEAEAGYEDHPAVELTWYAAHAYCAWAGRRLPTEAEWEKAARGPEGQLYPWGGAIPTCNLANYSDCRGSTIGVGLLADGASPYGALDMSGNVSEWVADWYGEDYYDGSPGNNPPGPDAGEYKVLRGGSWWDAGGFVTAVHRFMNNPLATSNIAGFRCALSH